MAEQFQTSFIPKKSFDDVSAPKVSKTGGILFALATILLLLSLVSAGGVFAYGRFLESSITNKKEALQKARAAFEPELIRELSHLDMKFKTSEELLTNHIAVSGIFDLLEDITLETVRFTDFSFGLDPKGIRLSMSGTARSFTSVALQSDEFGKNRFISEPLFSGFDLDERGNVTFSVTAIVDPSVVSYVGRVKDGGTASFDIAPTVAGASVDEPVATDGVIPTNL